MSDVLDVKNINAPNVVMVTIQVTAVYRLEKLEDGGAYMEALSASDYPTVLVKAIDPLTPQIVERATRGTLAAVSQALAEKYALGPAVKPTQEGAVA